MAVYEAPVRHEDHYIEHDSGSSAGFWAVLIVLAALVLLLLFGSNIFGGGGNNSGTEIQGGGTVNVQ